MDYFKMSRSNDCVETAIANTFLELDEPVLAQRAYDIYPHRFSEESGKFFFYLIHDLVEEATDGEYSSVVIANGTTKNVLEIANQARPDLISHVEKAIESKKLVALKNPEITSFPVILAVAYKVPTPPSFQGPKFTEIDGGHAIVMTGPQMYIEQGLKYRHHGNVLSHTSMFAIPFKEKNPIEDIVSSST